MLSNTASFWYFKAMSVFVVMLNSLYIFISQLNPCTAKHLEVVIKTAVHMCICNFISFPIHWSGQFTDHLFHVFAYLGYISGKQALPRRQLRWLISSSLPSLHLHQQLFPGGRHHSMAIPVAIAWATAGAWTVGVGARDAVGIFVRDWYAWPVLNVHWPLNCGQGESNKWDVTPKLVKLPMNVEHHCLTFMVETFDYSTVFFGMFRSYLLK